MKDMRNILIAILFVLFCLVSCVTKNRLVHLFLSEEYICPQISLIEKDSIQNPYMMRLVDNRLFMCNVFSSPLVTYFNWDTGKYIGSFGNKGMGNGEFTDFNSVSVYDSTLVLFEGNKKECIFISDVNNPADYRTVKIEQVEDIVPFKVMALEEDLLLAVGMVKNGRFALYDGKGHFLSVFGQYPQNDGHNKNDFVRDAFAFQAHISYEPVSKILAIGNAFGEGISFYNLENINKPYLIKEILMHAPSYRDASTENKSSVVFTKDNIMGFVDICVTGKYFAGLFCGEKRERGKEWKGGNCLLIFDIEGTPIKKVMLPKRYLQLSVSDEDLVLLGFDNETSDFEVDKIDLNQI